jgi:hypothetical protein
MVCFFQDGQFQLLQMWIQQFQQLQMWIQQFQCFAECSRYLMHELHFRGLSDMAIWHHEDWSLYGLDKYQVQEKIMELNLKGGYIAQCSGELLTISWNYQTMEEFINGAI